MIHSLTFNIESERIVVISENGSVLTDIPNIVVFAKNNKIVSIGETQESLQKNYPQEWEQTKGKVRFCEIFSVDNFNPQLTANAINLLAYFTTHQSAESQNKWFKDTIELRLNISGYGKLKETARELFDYYTQEGGFVRIKSLVINNQVKALGKIRLAEWAAKIGIPFALSPMAFLVIYVLKTIIGEKFSATIPDDKTWSFFAIFMLASILFIYVALFLSVVIWRITTRNLISDIVSKTIIERRKIGLPKRLVNLLWLSPYSHYDDG